MSGGCTLVLRSREPTQTNLDVDDDLSFELESGEFLMAEAASTFRPDFDQSRHSCWQKNIALLLPTLQCLRNALQNALHTPLASTSQPNRPFWPFSLPCNKCFSSPP